MRKEDLFEILPSFSFFTSIIAQKDYIPKVTYNFVKDTKIENSDFDEKSFREKRLKKIEIEVLSCKKCGLWKNRRKAVFGEGDPMSKVVFVGEAPGRDEDIQGRPFCGRAGMLLTKMIEALGFKREDVYITNVVKCRPPGNRDPKPEEISACRPYLEAQLDIIKPKVICALGSFSAKTLLSTDTKISGLRGKLNRYKDSFVIPTYHPAFLLRNPNMKRIVWQDLKKIKELV